MLTRLRVRNFKMLKDIDVELGNTVVFIGPNNSGKTTALQALALWDIGLRKWNEKRKGKGSPGKRPGVTVNKKDLIAIPIPQVILLWKNLNVRNGYLSEGGTQITKNVRMEITVEGITNEKKWECGLEFDYGNEESFYCRPLRIDETASRRMEIPEQASENINIAFLQPMSGLSAVEPKWEPGRINVLLGEGQTAQVLRNLCYQIYKDKSEYWKELGDYIKKLFAVTLLPPKYVEERGEITMAYKVDNITLDLSCSGKGFQQTLLLLAYLYSNPKAILLIDEPDAHLEIIRQRNIYNLITEIAEKQGSQIIAASHSEILLDEAAERDIVVAFVGKPHRINDRGSQVLKALREIGYDQYYQAEQKGWVLYLEGSTDLAIIQEFAKTLGHPAYNDLEMPFVYYVQNQPQKARSHFFGLREAKSDLLGIAIFDNIDRQIQTSPALIEMKWKKKELENYLCLREVLISYSRYEFPDETLWVNLADKRERIMTETINEIEEALNKLNKPSPWSDDVKASDDFLDPLFNAYFKKLELPNLLYKTDYHILAKFVPKDEIHKDVIETIDAIYKVAKKAKPAT